MGAGKGVDDVSFLGGFAALKKAYGER